jgi:hypothetical protein
MAAIMGGIFELPAGSMKRTRLFCSSIALLLAGCAEPATTSQECGRLAGLCSDREEVVGLGRIASGPDLRILE